VTDASVPEKPGSSLFIGVHVDSVFVMIDIELIGSSQSLHDVLLCRSDRFDR
jgi:hypothetical protein